jgi:hypothetical protein
MNIDYNWDLNPLITGLCFQHIQVETVLRFNYFNNGSQIFNFFYDASNSICLHSKFSSKNICDYYKGYSIIKDGLYKNHLIDPSSLHIWDSTFEKSQETVDLRQKILSRIEAQTEDYKICLPIYFNNILYCYSQIGKNNIPQSQDLTYLNNSFNSINILSNLNLAYPNLNFNLVGVPWYERHFPIFINPELYPNTNDTVYNRLIYFYYQRQNPYVEKKYFLSKNGHLFCDFYIEDCENICLLKNKYLISNYGYAPNSDCISCGVSDINGYYSGLNYSGEFIGAFSSRVQLFSNNFNKIYTSIDKNGNVYDFQQCIIDFGNSSGFYFCYCKNTFFTNFCCDVKNFANNWYLNTTNFCQQYHGLPNLDLSSEINLNPPVSSDYYSEIKCKNVII